MLRGVTVSCAFEVRRHDVDGPRGLGREEWGTTTGARPVLFEERCRSCRRGDEERRFGGG